ncbi:MAG: dethiobiotin synthase [Alphaproteobacteria bacterium]|nr:dethiobiotin synthase [Alphaproteobacteria bacterium]MCD8519796.1 dethiobiotin synthase [Alphaproteobacteria bacterium]MCD8525819.1 dethiobiotin synthase [Alphaproteobacteria bacterium]MCD8571437.1 dethiobiotin synthase [Alphaproteobacteria bacterium]
MQSFIITGTDTGIGKTVASAMLTQALGTNYWKPVQSGIEGMVDARVVQKLTALPDDRFLPESYVLSEPLSPHRAAELDRVEIDMNRLIPPASERRLIIEGAGGLMVPITRNNLQINMFKSWDIPLILCARTGLGTINHTLLSIEALWNRQMKIHGLLFIGEENRDNIKTIAEYSGVKVLGRLPLLVELNAANLQQAFSENFKAEDFA